jgi:hypothetical protein
MVGRRLHNRGRRVAGRCHAPLYERRIDSAGSKSLHNRSKEVALHVRARLVLLQHVEQGQIDRVRPLRHQIRHKRHEVRHIVPAAEWHQEAPEMLDRAGNEDSIARLLRTDAGERVQLIPGKDKATGDGRRAGGPEAADDRVQGRLRLFAKLIPRLARAGLFWHRVPPHHHHTERRQKRH